MITMIVRGLLCACCLALGVLAAQRVAGSSVVVFGNRYQFWSPFEEQTSWADRLANLNDLGEVRNEARKMIRAAPLDEDVLIRVAQRETSEHSAPVLAEMLRRNPRSRLARIELLREAVNTADCKAALAQLAILAELIPDRLETVGELGAGIVQSLDCLDELRTYLGPARPWTKAVLRELNKSYANLEDLLGLNRDLADDQSSYLARLLEERGLDAAFLAWMYFLPDDQRADLHWPYDAEFRRKAGALPFNWQTNQRDTEFLGEGGLYALYSGRGAGVFASQIVVLSSGRYRLEVDMQGEGEANGGSFTWGIDCYETSASLGVLPIKGLLARQQTYSLEFQVPDQECNGQRLTLRGQPGAFPVRSRGWAKRVQIVPIDTEAG